MGQIIGSAAKPKRCNLNKLSQLGTPAAGEYILVSYDNSMTANGQGNFDRYIIGDGRTAATALELKYLDDSTRPYIVEEVNKAVADIQPIEITGDVTNAPDEEDLTSENQGGTDVLKFKDKAYNSALYSGLGRVYLRKNIVTLEGVGKNVLTQAMVNTANTIYHIQYDYDLNGETITLPAGCVLEFEGGSLANGTLAGSNTAIDADNVVIFGDDIIVSGTWLIPNIYSDWFANITETNRIKNLFRLTNSAITNNVYIKKTSEPYKVAITRYSEEWRREDIIDINTDNNNVYIDGTIQLEANGMWGYNIITIDNVNNIKISGGTIIGDALEHDYSTYQDSHPTHEFGYGIAIIGSNNIEIENIDIKLCTGDCVCFERFGESKINNVVIRNFLFEQARRQGISITENVENVQIVNGTIQNIGDLSETITGTAPKHAIDIEPTSGYASNIFISNLDIHDCTGGGIMIYNNGNADINNIAIENIIYNTEAENRKFGVEFYAVKNARLNGYIGNIGVRVTSCRGCKLSHIYIKDGISGNLFAGTSTIQIEDMVADITDNDIYLFNLYNGSSVKVLAKNCKVSCNKLLFVAQGSSIVIEDSELNFSWHYCTTPECLYKNCNMNIVCGDETIGYFSAENCIINISEIKKLLPISFYKVIGCDVTASTDVEGRTVFYSDTPKSIFSNNKVVSNSSLMAILLWDNALKIEDNNLSFAAGKTGTKYFRRGGCTPTSYGLLSKYGDTRPTIANGAIEYKGFPFFDTTINKMIYWTGTSWVDATGTAVQ
jgi:hypothetical protein